MVIPFKHWNSHLSTKKVLHFAYFQKPPEIFLDNCKNIPLVCYFMTKKKNRLQSSLYPLLFLLSASGIALEVSLTRLFSYLFTHSYVYIIISVSMAGLGLGSVLMRILQGGIRQKVLRTALFLPAFLAGVLLLSSLLQAAVIVSLLMAFFIFMTIGLFQVLVFQQPQVQAGKLYASDLSGAAFGSVAAFLVLNL